MIVASETSHAVAAVIQEANKAKQEGKQKGILLNLSGHGLMNLNGYDSYLQGKLTNQALAQEEIDKSLRTITGHPAFSNQKTKKR